MSQPFLEIDKVNKSFAKFRALQDLSLSLQKGEALALLGESGCGKTTLLRCIAGLETPDSGKISLAGEVIFQAGQSKVTHQRNIGLVFQDYAVFPHMNVADNITYGIKNSKEKKAILGRMLGLLNIEDQSSKMPSQLSGGQLQRVAIARTLAATPALVLLDEPFSNLDKKLAIDSRNEIKAIFSEQQLPSILVTHDQQEAFAYADTVAIMKKGRILQRASPEQLYCQPTSLEVAHFLGHCHFIAGQSDGNMVETALGKIPVSNGVAGTVQVPIRPESLDLVEVSDGPFTIRAQKFLGNCRELELCRDDLSLLVRVNPYRRFAIGSQCSVTVKHEVPVFEQEL